MKNNFNSLNEKILEQKVEKEFNLLGWNSKSFQTIDRQNWSEVIDRKIFLQSLLKINNVSEKLIEKAFYEITNYFDTSLEITNQKCHDWIKNGIQIFDIKEKRDKTIFLIDEKNIDNNCFNLVRQLEVSNGKKIRIPDIVLYVNGLPLVVIELKAPNAEETLYDAFKQIQTLKEFNCELFKFNFFIFLSSYDDNKYGSLTSSYNRFFNLKIENIDHQFKILFKKENFLNILFNYTYYEKKEGKSSKIIAGMHQIIAVEKTIKTLQKSKTNKGGIVWHTQGTGKSFSMIFLTRKIIRHFKKATIIIVTDRKTLDDQIYEIFLKGKQFLRNQIEKITSRDNLISKLKNKGSFGVYFTTVQKFYKKTKLLSTRNDIFVLVDEAHRTHNTDYREKINQELKNVETKDSYARCLRIAFPNAKLTAFTGTPLFGEDRDTRHQFGNYNHIYSLNDAVEDKFTVPIFYEIRKTKITLNQKYTEKLDQIQKKYFDTLNPNDQLTNEKQKALIRTIKDNIVLEDADVINAKLKDILNHYQKRAKILNGKAIIVANTRKAALRYYQKLKELNFCLWEKTILVITGTNKDDHEMSSSRISDSQLKEVSKEFRKENSKYKIAIVVYRWLTGFDVPDLDVIYIDRLLRMHNLMQAIARVNRVYYNKKTQKNKESGLVVDYIGIWKQLSQALLKYAAGAKGIDNSLLINENIEKAKQNLKDLLEIIDNYYIRNIRKYYLLNDEQKFEYIMKNTEILLGYKKDELEKRNRFIKICKKLNVLYKITFTILQKSEIEIIKVVLLIKSQILRTSLKKDEQFFLYKQQLKKTIQDAVESEDPEIKIKHYQSEKDISEVVKRMEKEIDQLMKKYPQNAIKKLCEILKWKIDKMENSRPVFALKASQKLKNIIERLKNQIDIEKTKNLIIELSREIKNKAKEKLEFPDNSLLQSFFEIVAEDKFLKKHHHSEILRRIAKDLQKVFKENVKSEFKNNPIIRDTIYVELIKLLKNKYDYPPKDVNEPTGLVIDRIENEIKLKTWMQIKNEQNL